MAPVHAQSQNREQRGKRGLVRLRRGKPHIVLDRPPGQQPWLLKHHADPRVRRTRYPALIVMVEAGHDLQQGALAAAGWSDEHADLASAQRKVEIGKNVVPLAGSAGERLARDLDFKLHGAATLIVGPLTAAPGRVRWRGRPPRMSSNRRAGG